MKLWKTISNSLTKVWDGQTVINLNTFVLRYEMNVAALLHKNISANYFSQLASAYH